MLWKAPAWTNIHAGYDPTQGNILSFGVKRSYEGSQDRGSGSPRDDFYAWTSQFAEDHIAGTPKEAYSQGRGWRMAVILNGSIISKPCLKCRFARWRDDQRTFFSAGSQSTGR